MEGELVMQLAASSVAGHARNSRAARKLPSAEERMKELLSPA